MIERDAPNEFGPGGRIRNGNDMSITNLWAQNLDPDWHINTKIAVGTGTILAGIVMWHYAMAGGMVSGTRFGFDPAAGNWRNLATGRFVKAAEVAEKEAEGARLIRLSQIWQDRGFFLNWLKGNHSLSRIANPLSHAEARQVLLNAKRLKIPYNTNPVGLAGSEQTGRWAGIPHFKVGNIHIPVQPGFTFP
jgi:hypothetical protein